MNDLGFLDTSRRRIDTSGMRSVSLNPSPHNRQALAPSSHHSAVLEELRWQPIVDRHLEQATIKQLEEKNRKLREENIRLKQQLQNMTAIWATVFPRPIKPTEASQAADACTISFSHL